LTPPEGLGVVGTTGGVFFTIFRGMALFLGARAFTDVVTAGKELGTAVGDELVFRVPSVDIEAVGLVLDSVEYESKSDSDRVAFIVNTQKEKSEAKHVSLLFLPFSKDDNCMNVWNTVFVEFGDSFGPMEGWKGEEV